MPIRSSRCSCSTTRSCRQSFNRPNRTGFLSNRSTDLGRALAALGAPLVIRRGDWVCRGHAPGPRVGADQVHVSADVSGYAQRHEEALSPRGVEAGIDFEAHPGTTVVPPGAIVPSTDGEHYKVFTPYYRRWLAAHAPASGATLRRPADVAARVGRRADPGAVRGDERSRSPEVMTAGGVRGTAPASTRGSRS